MLLNYAHNLLLHQLVSIEKMITSIGQEGLQAKQEEPKHEGRNTSKTLPCTSRQWSSFRNPRIVRVSRSFGGKDRHSKVCTVRGLRDRRIRLSVPTAVQLYDLQEKLGLNQPSKVVDWLLDVTKEDIDNLPPLQMPPGFGQFGSRNLMGDLLLPYESNPSYHQSPLFQTNASNLLSKQGLRISDGHDDGKFWEMESGLRMKNKEEIHDQKGKSPLPINATMPYSYNHFENPYFSEPFFNPNSLSLPSSSLALPSGSHLYLCPTALPSLFPSYPSYLTPLNEADTRQGSHFQLLNTATGPSQPSAMPASRFFQANLINSKYLHHLHGNGPSQSDKGVNDS